MTVTPSIDPAAEFQTLRGQSADLASQFAFLCQAIDADPTRSPWSYTAQEVTVHDSLDVTFKRTWILDSLRLKELMGQFSQLSVVPLVPLDFTSSTANSVTIAGMASVRQADPIPERTLASLMPPGSLDSVRNKWLAVPMTAQEFTSSPVVEVGAESHYKSPDLFSFTLRQIWPVGSLDIVFNGNTPITALVVNFPSTAHVDVVALRCELDWSDYAEQIDDVLARAELGGEGDAAEGVWTTACNAIDTACVYQVHGVITELLDGIEQGGTQALGASQYKKTRELWVASVKQTEAALNAWAAAWRAAQGDGATAGQVNSVRVREAARTLSDALKIPVEFFLLGKVSSDGSVDQAALVTALRGSTDKIVRVNSMLAPFTSEREPSTQGKRSALILGLLGIMMLGSAWIDLTWLPHIRLFSWLPHTRNVSGEAISSRANDLRDSLVALFLIFPAALYGQFFQLRPRSLVGHRAESGTFAALSAVFALPLLAAALYASGGSLYLVSILCVAIGLIAVVCAVGIWILFSGTMLARARVGALLAEVKGEIRNPNVNSRSKGN